jgi:ABC-type branched-subunit amino acid transport system substrate-binding protein/cytochrome c553
MRTRFVLAVLTVITALTLNAAEPMASERLGREIYTHGKGSDTAISAYIGDGRTKVAAAVVPCASCHGADGRGRPEGGVVPSDITPAALAVPRESETQGGRRHGPYTDRLLKRAITMGMDAAGNALAPTMPRYEMSLHDMNALLSYLHRVGDEQDPGLTADAIRIGVLLPPREHLAEVGDAMRGVLRAFAAARNAAGGVYDRKLELVFAETSGTAAERAAAAAAFLDREKPFALVGSFTDGADSELAEVAEQHGTPLLATISSHAQTSTASRRYVRDLVAGLTDQTRALAQFVGRRFPTAKVAVLHDADSSEAAGLALAELHAQKIGAASFPAGTTAAALRQGGIDTILYTGGAEGLAALAKSMQELRWHPALLLPSSLVQPAIFDGSDSAAHIFIALPLGPHDQTPAAVAAWRKLAESDGGTERHQAAQFAALASAELLVAALERAGRDLTRDKFLNAIDTTTALETGLVPPLTFTPTRHVGSTGAYVVNVGDPGAVDAVTWVDPG